MKAFVCSGLEIRNFPRCIVDLQDGEKLPSALMIGLLAATSAGLTPCPGRCRSTTPGTSVEEPWSVTAGSSVLHTAISESETEIDLHHHALLKEDFVRFCSNHLLRSHYPSGVRISSCVWVSSTSATRTAPTQSTTVTPSTATSCWSNLPSQQSLVTMCSPSPCPADAPLQVPGVLCLDGEPPRVPVSLGKSCEREETFYPCCRTSSQLLEDKDHFMN